MFITAMYYSRRKNNCQKIKPEHCIITNRVFSLRGSCFCKKYISLCSIVLTKTTNAQNDVALSYRKVRGAIFSGSCFCGDYSSTSRLLITFRDFTHS